MWKKFLAEKCTYQNTCIYYLLYSATDNIENNMLLMIKWSKRPTGIGTRPCAPLRALIAILSLVFFLHTACYMYTQNHGLRYREMAVRVPPPI